MVIDETWYKVAEGVLTIDAREPIPDAKRAYVIADVLTSADWLMNYIYQDWEFPTDEVMSTITSYHDVQHNASRSIRTILDGVELTLNPIKIQRTWGRDERRYLLLLNDPTLTKDQKRRLNKVRRFLYEHVSVSYQEV